MTLRNKKYFQYKGRSKETSQPRREIFHSIVAKFLWVMKQGRPDIEFPIFFSSTRVQHPDLDDWVKLKHVLQFLWSTKYDNRKIGTRDLHSLHTYINTSYAIPDNQQSHTGGLITRVIGTIHGTSFRQN